MESVFSAALVCHFSSLYMCVSSHLCTYLCSQVLHRAGQYTLMKPVLVTPLTALSLPPTQNVNAHACQHQSVRLSVLATSQNATSSQLVRT